MAPPPLSRQQPCGECGHEEHTFFDCEWCLCQAHLPPGDPRRPENHLSG